MIEKEYKGEWFRYDPEEGRLWRKWPNGNWIEVAIAAKFKANNSYPTVHRKNAFKETAHRLAWILAYNTIPDGHIIDHINGIITDYRIINLRCVSGNENQRNRAVNKNSKTGIAGVTKTKTGLFKVQITIDGVIKNLGRFKSKKEAARVRICAEIEHGFHLNHGRKPIKR